MKKLFIIRHGKSDWGNPIINDFNRPLNHRGLKDAPRIGQYMQVHHDKPDLILTSPAKRALTTSHIIADNISYDTSKIMKEDRIYLANLETLLEVVQSLDNNLNCVYIFGHNPGFSTLASYLTDDWIEMKTCCVAVLEADVDSWHEWIKGIGFLKEFISPKIIK